MEDEVEQVLSGSLLARDLKIALLEPLEVINAIVCQEVETELDTLNFFHD